jgi:hypothetical protein
MERANGERSQGWKCESGLKPVINHDYLGEDGRRALG